MPIVNKVGKKLPRTKAFVLYKSIKAKFPIDVIKENISHFCETKIERSFLSREEKEAQKRQMKQSLEVYIQGVKDEMRRAGRMR